ncbi:MAG: redoxin domain-containing protein [Bacteroidota bacterium]
MKFNVGDLAPDFTLKSDSFENITLSDFQGNKNVVLIFFPLINLEPCENELCSVRDELDSFTQYDATVLGISVDSAFALKLWSDQHKFSFPLLSDFNKEITARYGVQYDVFLPGNFDYYGVAKRSVFVIDKDGIIRYTEVLEDGSNIPNYETIKETLQKLM